MNSLAGYGDAEYAASEDWDKYFYKGDEK